MIERYVNGGSFVKPFFDVESIPSGQPRRRWLPRVASEVRGFLWVDSLDSLRNPLFPERWLRKPLKMSRNLRRAGAGGFRVDSPVKRPDARKVSGCAPPYTFGAGEEPCRGGVIGPELPFVPSATNDRCQPQSRLCRKYKRLTEWFT